MSANSAIAAQPSYVILPRESELNGQSFTHVIDFLQWKFAQIGADVWRARMAAGKVHWQNGELIDANSRYHATKRVYYYREVVAETKVPFSETILHQDEHCIVVYKPHFLPVTPGGNYVNECLLHRLRIATGIDTIAPAHRLDKDTAGVILMTVNPAVRAQYHQLFVDGNIAKTYQAIAELPPELVSLHAQGALTLPMHWTVKNRLKPSTPSFTMAVVAGEANSHSEITLIDVQDGLGLFELSPITGKTHQLRVHMQSLGMPILNDRFYPQLQPKGPDNFAKPLQLLAQKLSFIDPITKQSRCFIANGLAWKK
ncbi:RluA family pseudouridine synthase [Shewanella intestini]|uniref:Pseudouridine synthase n=1 Tax=Shewanella intestini TaxID=2017544 RepID=A0ABS5I3A2_9GAMM|nr:MULTISPECIES: RluA family pseudouridine synthase [Shewanella]MBR9728376.1 pseudouridine synthase [Shewanella intestini]MRG36718.1 pseudouridine synthase [Shewanella sp. XMDDZSB0408]